MAKRYPRATIVALSNSHGQRQWIEARAAELGLGNLTVHTGDIVEFDFPDMPSGGRFDRVVSIEMFEHMKSYGSLLAKVARWMKADAMLFVHMFAHRTLAYHFEVRDATDWMSRHFFTGGTMPSEALLLHFQDDLRVERQWWLSGEHYARTAGHWLAGLDAARGQLMPISAQAYGEAGAPLWFQRWRMFYMAVAELFGYGGGNEWGWSTIASSSAEAGALIFRCAGAVAAGSRMDQQRQGQGPASGQHRQRVHGIGKRGGAQRDAGTERQRPGHGAEQGPPAMAGHAAVKRGHSIATRAISTSRPARAARRPAA